MNELFKFWKGVENRSGGVVRTFLQILTIFLARENLFAYILYTIFNKANKIEIDKETMAAHARLCSGPKELTEFHFNNLSKMFRTVLGLVLN